MSLRDLVNIYDILFKGTGNFFESKRYIDEESDNEIQPCSRGLKTSNAGNKSTQPIKTTTNPEKNQKRKRNPQRNEKGPKTKPQNQKTAKTHKTTNTKKLTHCYPTKTCERLFDH